MTNAKTNLMQIMFLIGTSQFFQTQLLRMGHVLITCFSLTSRSLGTLQNESIVAFRLFLNLENQPSRRLRPRALRKSRQEFARD